MKKYILLLIFLIGFLFSCGESILEEKNNNTQKPIEIFFCESNVYVWDFSTGLASSYYGVISLVDKDNKGNRTSCETKNNGLCHFSSSVLSSRTFLIYDGLGYNAIPAHYTRTVSFKKDEPNDFIICVKPGSRVEPQVPSSRFIVWIYVYDAFTNMPVKDAIVRLQKDLLNEEKIVVDKSGLANFTLADTSFNNLIINAEGKVTYERKLNFKLGERSDFIICLYNK